MEDKQVETLFSFDEEVLKKALKNIYSKDFHPMTDIEENLFEATWKTMNKATDKGFGTRKTDDPDYDFYREIRMNNAVFAAFKVHRAQNDMAALLLDKNGSLKPFEQWHCFCSCCEYADTENKNTRKTKKHLLIISFLLYTYSFTLKAMQR